MKQQWKLEIRKKKEEYRMKQQVVRMRRKERRKKYIGRVKKTLESWIPRVD